MKRREEGEERGKGRGEGARKEKEECVFENEFRRLSVVCVRERRGKWEACCASVKTKRRMKTETVTESKGE